MKTWLLRLAVAVLFIFVGANKCAVHSEWVGIFERIALIPGLLLPGVLAVGGEALLSLGSGRKQK